MPRKPSTKEQVKFTIAMPAEVLKKAEGWIKKFSEDTGVRVSRNAGIVALIERGLKKE